MDGFVDAFLLDPMSEPPVFGNQFEVKFSPVIHRQKDLRGMVSLVPSVLSSGFDSIHDVHAAIVPSVVGQKARVFLKKRCRDDGGNSRFEVYIARRKMNHQPGRRLEERGLIERTPSVARSIRLLVARDQVPELE